VPPLTRERIIATAIRMADRDGFDAVTMRRIASELDVHVTSLYNHVADRDAVTDGIVEALVEEAKLPVAPVDWEEWTRTFFTALGTVAASHPGAFTALQRRPVQGVRAAAAFEVALDAFRRGGFAPTDAYNALKAVTLTALTVGLERALASRGQAAESELGALPADQFPNLRRLPEITDVELAWSFTLETLVAGLRAQLALARGGAKRSRASS
jgi:AcrR family transcriptional regulator